MTTEAATSPARIPVSDLPIMEPPSLQGLDVYDYFRDRREEGPLLRMGLGVLALRARHVDLITSDATRQIETETKVMQGVVDGPIFDFIDQVMLFANGDAHARRRGPIARTFAFKLIEAVRPKAAAVAADLIEELRGSGPVDFLNDIAAQIPARIIADVLGIPRTDLPVFMRWIRDTSEAIGFIDLEHRPRIEASLTEFNAYVDGLLADRRANPVDDFLSDYVAATQASGDMSEGEIRAQIVGLILAGSDTTRNAMCMTLHQLLRHPDQWRAFVGDPDGLKKAVVEEGLRFEPVVSAIPRLALRDIEIDHFIVPAGSILAVSILSVLRDSDVYDRPDAFDILRTDQPRWHLAFGAGAHRCAGEALARIELEETLATIARMAPNMRVLDPSPKLRPGAIRSVDQMTVDFDPAA